MAFLPGSCEDLSGGIPVFRIKGVAKNDMHLARIRIRDYRNYARIDQTFTPGFHVFLGDNAQGKTNLLEAIYLLATLRSFRGVGGGQLIKHGRPGYFLGGTVVSHSSREIKLYWSVRERKIHLDDQVVRKVTDYLGVLRAVVFCTEDLQLIKGPASRRRRFMDLLLSQTHSHYLPLLQRYTRALRSRNALLKQRNFDGASLEVFSRELVSSGTELLRLRSEFIPKLMPLVQQACSQITREGEEVRIEYAPGIRDDFKTELLHSEAKDRVMRATTVGPHRDEVRIMLDDRNASQFGSEGQKRTLAIGFKMAQAEYLTSVFGFPPVLLIDDVMGELDVRRRSGLLPLLERSHQARGQVFMTCTEENWPRELGRELHRWRVHQGSIREMISEV